MMRDVVLLLVFSGIAGGALVGVSLYLDSEIAENMREIDHLRHDLDVAYHRLIELTARGRKTEITATVAAAGGGVGGAGGDESCYWEVHALDDGTTVFMASAPPCKSPPLSGCQLTQIGPRAFVCNAADENSMPRSGYAWIGRSSNGGDGVYPTD